MNTRNHPLLSDDLIRLIETTQGVRPKAAPIPRPGYYWLRETRCGFYWIDKDGTRLDNPQHGQIWSVYTWELQEIDDWFIARVDKDGSFEVIGDDQTGSWEGEHHLITHVSSRIREPGI